MTTPSFPRMHASFYVKDIRKTVDFYQKFFGSKPTKVKADYAKFELAEPSLIISFVENASRVGSGFGHLGIQVETPELLAGYRERAEAEGLVDREEIGVACCYATQDKFWAKDPDGIQWEIYYFHEDAEFNDPQYAAESAEACCAPATPAKPKLALGALNAREASPEAACCEPGAGCC